MWSYKIPNNYKRDKITSELHRAKKIAADFDKELRRIKRKFLHAGYPVSYKHIACIPRWNDVERNVSASFQREIHVILSLSMTLFSDSTKKRRIVSNTKMVIWWNKISSYQFTFCTRNEKFSKPFINKWHIFTNGNVRFNIIWNTRKIQSLFSNKDKLQHLSCVIYKGVCSCGADYIGETTRNVKIRWNE